MTSCDWNSPGADRFTGSVPSAIASYGLPIKTQTALIAAFERREFTDSVVIDRDSIRGNRHEYEPEIRSMHFGSAGRICGMVTRSGWPAEHVETALVLCADGECIGWPAVCGNVFRLTRTRDQAAQPGFDAEPLGLPDPGLALPADVRLLAVPPESGDALTVDQPDEPTGDGLRIGEVMTAPYGAAGIGIGIVGPLAVAAPISPVPEPSTWLTLLAGIVAIAFCRWSRP